MGDRGARVWLWALVVLLAVTATAAVVLGCGSAQQAASPAPSPSGTAAGEVLTRADLTAFVDKAVAYAAANGKEAALVAFNAPSGEFNHGELYIFAYDFSGKNLAHGYDQSLVGKDLIDLTDPTGKPIIRDFVGIARGGSGWLYYEWANPAHDGRVEPKVGYIRRVDDGWLLGAGIYGPDARPAPSASPSP